MKDSHKGRKPSKYRSITCLLKKFCQALYSSNFMTIRPYSREYSQKSIGNTTGSENLSIFKAQDSKINPHTAWTDYKKTFDPSVSPLSERCSLKTPMGLQKMTFEDNSKQLAQVISSAIYIKVTYCLPFYSVQI